MLLPGGGASLGAGAESPLAGAPGAATAVPGAPPPLPPSGMAGAWSTSFQGACMRVPGGRACSWPGNPPHRGGSGAARQFIRAGTWRRVPPRPPPLPPPRGFRAVAPSGSYSVGPQPTLRDAAPPRSPPPARHALSRVAFSFPAALTISASCCPMTKAGDPGTALSVSAGPKSEAAPGHPRPRLSQCRDSGRDTILHNAHGLDPGSNTPHQEHSANMRVGSCLRSQPAVQHGIWGLLPGRPSACPRSAPTSPVGAIQCSSTS